MTQIDLSTNLVDQEVRIGVFVCHCGTNIAGFLDVSQVTRYAQTLPQVVLATDSLYTCTNATLTEIKQAIKEHRLNRVVVASCTPRTHEPLFRNTCREAGLNPYLFEFVNIRDQCSWVHMKDWDRATDKAKDLVRMGVAKAKLLEPQEEVEVEVYPAALIIGGGIAGMTAALTLAERGFSVKLIEKKATLGGLVSDLYRLYPMDIDGSSLAERKIRLVLDHPQIEVFTSTQLLEAKGFVGNYEILLATNGSQKSLKVGVIIVATGAEVFEPEGFYAYDGKRVVTQKQLDKTLQKAKLQAKKVVMIQCVGTRTEERPYCSRICCTIAVKNARMIKESNPEAEVFILYRDIQTYGIEYEEYVDEARRMGIIFIKYSPDDPPVVEETRVRVKSCLLGTVLRIPYDLVVLSSPLVAPSDAGELAQLLKVPQDQNGFFLEAHVKLRPVDFATDGIYLCGSAHWPAHIGESITQAFAAASRASILLSRGSVTVEPIISLVDEEKCIGCGLCELMCPYRAVTLVETPQGRKAQTTAASCKGCGACGAGCPQQAIRMQNFTDAQITAQIKALACSS